MEILETDNLQHFAELHKAHFNSNFPMISPGYVPIIKEVRDDKGNVIACAAIKLHIEATMVTDQDAPESARVRALDGLIDDLEKWSLENGIEQVHVYTNSEFARVLAIRYGFRHVRNIVVVKNIGDQ